MGIGVFFESFESAWAHFLAREEPLESFWDDLSDDPAATVRVWLIVPPDDVRRKVREIQAAFSELDWIAPLPEHFLHVSVWVDEADELDVDSASRAWADIAPFPIAYRQANCFHDAVIVEAHTQGVTALVGRALPEADRSRLLPHVSIGYMRRSGRADPLRTALRPLRPLELGTGIADEVLLCDVPVAKSTFLRPWRVVGSVTLGGLALE